MTPIITTQRPVARLPDTTIGAEFVFDEQPLWRWAVLNAEETHDGIQFALISQDKLRSPVMGSLRVKVSEGGPALLAAWHRDRRHRSAAERGAPDAEA